MGKENSFAAHAARILDAMPEEARLCDVPVQFLLDFARLCGYEDKPVTFVVARLHDYLDDLWHTYAVDDMKEIVSNFYMHAINVEEYEMWWEIQKYSLAYGDTLLEAFKEWDV